jgi:hypothetical protein
MLLTEEEISQLEAIKNKLKRLQEYYRAKAQEADEQIERLMEIQRTQLSWEKEKDLPTLENETPLMRRERPRGAVTEGIKQYIRKSGAEKFTPSQAVSYLRARLQVPNSKELYNSAYRALTRMAEKGELLKENELFSVPGAPRATVPESH